MSFVLRREAAPVGDDGEAFDLEDDDAPAQPSPSGAEITVKRQRVSADDGRGFAAAAAPESRRSCLICGICGLVSTATVVPPLPVMIITVSFTF